MSAVALMHQRHAPPAGGRRGPIPIGFCKWTGQSLWRECEGSLLSRRRRLAPDGSETQHAQAAEGHQCKGAGLGDDGELVVLLNRVNLVSVAHEIVIIVHVGILETG